jgi:hypothetical protein
MRRPSLIIGVCAVVAGLLLFVALEFRGSAARRGGNSYDANHESHLVGFSLVHEAAASGPVFTASLTNHYDVPIFLRGHAIQHKDDRGQVENGPRGWSILHPWVGVTNFDTLLPGSVARISFPDSDVPRQAKHVRLVFQYFYDAGPIAKAASHVVTNLPVSKLSPEARYRLYQQGLLNGQHQRSYDGEWISNESVQRTGASRSADETNRASGAAGSRR